MKLPWFRLYSRIMTDPKIEMLSFEDQRHYIWLLCMKSEGYLDESFAREELFDRMVGRKLGLQGEALDAAKRRLVEVGLIDESWQPCAWERLQFASDRDPTGAERQRRRRQKANENKDVQGVTDMSRVTVTEITPLDTDTDTDKINCTKVQSSSQAANAASERPPRCPHRKIVELYHETLPTLPRVEKLTRTRLGYLTQRWNEDLPDLEHWRRFFLHVSQSDFLMGRTNGQNGRPPFRACLDWLCRPNNFAKIAEEQYHHHGQSLRH